MACFCDLSAQRLPNYAGMRFNFTPPTIPLQMKLGLMLGLQGDSLRLDAGISAWMGSVALPSLSFNPGALLQLQLAMGMFDLLDLPKLQAQLALAANSITHNIWPRLSFLLSLNLTPILQLALIARLQLALAKLNLDLTAGYPGGPNAHMIRIRPFQLRPPQITMGKLLLGLPFALQLQAQLGGPARASSHFSAMARLSPPKFGLGISIPLLLKLAMILEAIMTIRLAFGIDALSSDGLSRIAAMLKLYLALPLPSPMPDLSLDLMLDLPSLPALQAAWSSAPSSFSLSLPSLGLPIMLSLSAMVALQATLGLNLDACGPGACLLGGL